MNTKVYVDNLAAAITRNDLENLFSSYGNVTDVHVLMNRSSGRPHSFGCVTMATPEGARSAIQALDGKVMGLCTLSVGEAPPREAGGGPFSLRRNPLRSSSHLF